MDNSHYREQPGYDLVEKYLDIAGVIVVAIGSDHRVTLVNRKGCEVLGLRQEEIIGKDWFDNFLPGRMRAEVKVVFDRLMAGEIEPVEHFENSIVPASGEERTIEWHNTILRDAGGNIAGTLSSGTDVTDRKRADEELQRAYGELERSYKELERLNEMKSKFLSAVSHEFRTSLVVIRSYADIISQKRMGEVNETQQEKLQTVVKQADYLGNLVNTLLDLERIEAGEMKPKLEGLLLAESIDETIAGLFPLAVEKDVEITAEMGDRLQMVLADRNHLAQVLNNLVGNAIKFSPREAGITIRVTAAGNSVQVDVEDSGIGISPEHLPHVFDEFFRVPTRQARKYWGAGLGLSIVKHLVEEQGGMVWAKSEPGKGSTFSFTIPRVQEGGVKLAAAAG